MQNKIIQSFVNNAQRTRVYEIDVGIGIFNIVLYTTVNYVRLQPACTLFNHRNKLYNINENSCRL
jgi:hypothetical protein